MLDRNTDTLISLLNTSGMTNLVIALYWFVTWEYFYEGGFRTPLWNSTRIPTQRTNIQKKKIYGVIVTRFDVLCWVRSRKQEIGRAGRELRAGEAWGPLNRVTQYIILRPYIKCLSFLSGFISSLVCFYLFIYFFFTISCLYFSLSLSIVKKTEINQMCI